MLATRSCYMYFPEELAAKPVPPPTDTDKRALRSSANEVTFAWNALPDAKSYRIYYRLHGGKPDWTLLAEIPATPLPQYTASHDTLGNGEFEFAISAVYADGRESQPETSLGSMALPDTGWYLIWQR